MRAVCASDVEGSDDGDENDCRLLWEGFLFLVVGTDSCQKARDLNLKVFVCVTAIKLINLK